VKILVCIDDTDNLESIGTGRLSQIMADSIEKFSWGTCSAVSRHQLFVHDDIPYTSHNSSMCFSIDFNSSFDRLKDFGAGFLETKSAPGSDPGFCLANLDNGIDKGELMDFGYRAKQEVLSKQDAYNLAKQAGVYLSEHGGTGDGVVGALAGIGLRLSGNDGRFRGWGQFGKTGTLTTVKTLCLKMDIEAVFTVDGTILGPDTKIMIGADKIKTMMVNNSQVVLAAPVTSREQPRELTWRTLNKKEIKQY